MSQKLTFTTASILAEPNVYPLSLEARVDEQLVASLVCIDKEWYIVVVDSNRKTVMTKLDSVWKIMVKFGEFIMETDLDDTDDEVGDESDE